MNKLELKNARTALRDFYGASTECDWAEENLSWSKAARKRSSAETTLAQASPIAYGIYEIVTDFVVKGVGVSGCTDTKAYYLAHREYVADQLFSVLEKTLKD